VGSPHCAVCRSPFNDSHLQFLESKQPTPVNWAQRELKVHFGDLGLAWYRSDLNDVTASGKPLRRLEAPSLFEFNVFANQLLWILLHCVEQPSGRALVAENKTWVRFLLRLASIKSLPEHTPVSPAVVGGNAVSGGSAPFPSLAVDTKAPVDLSKLVQSGSPTHAASSPLQPGLAVALAVPMPSSASPAAESKVSAVQLPVLALPASARTVASAASKPAMALPASTVNSHQVNTDTTPSSLQSAILATRILRYVVPAVAHGMDLVRESAAAASSAANSGGNSEQASKAPRSVIQVSATLTPFSLPGSCSAVLCCVW
jgi:hypothetical protein